MFELRAILSVNGRVLGQSLLCRRRLVAPLHVLYPALPTTLSTADAEGRLHQLRLTRVAGIDRRWDVGIFECDGGHGGGVVLQSVLDGGSCAVAAQAIMYDVASHTYRLKHRLSSIREVVNVRAHAYRSASGDRLKAYNVRTFFLEHPFSPGWSGAPLCRRQVDVVVGFVHGNASANRGLGVCLAPDLTSPVVDLLSGAAS